MQRERGKFGLIRQNEYVSENIITFHNDPPRSACDPDFVTTTTIITPPFCINAIIRGRNFIAQCVKITCYETIAVFHDELGFFLSDG